MDLAPPETRLSWAWPTSRVWAPRTYTPGLAGHMGVTSMSNSDEVPAIGTSDTAGGTTTFGIGAAGAAAGALAFAAQTHNVRHYF